MNAGCQATIIRTRTTAPATRIPIRTYSEARSRRMPSRMPRNAAMQDLTLFRLEERGAAGVRAYRPRRSLPLDARLRAGDDVDLHHRIDEGARAARRTASTAATAAARAAPAAAGAALGEGRRGAGREAQG